MNRRTDGINPLATFSLIVPATINESSKEKEIQLAIKERWKDEGIEEKLEF